MAVLAYVLTAAPATSATLLVDDFDDGAYSYSANPDPFLLTVNANALGGKRSVIISANRRSTVITSSLIAGTSVLGFDTGAGPAGTLDQGSIHLRWSANGMDMSGYDTFLISFSSLQGTGTVNVVVNGTAYGSGSTKLPLMASGQFVVPFSQVDVQSGTFTSVSGIQLVMAGVTTDFAFTLDEVRLIPEPGVWATATCSLVLWVMRRRRAWSGDSYFGGT